MSLYTSEYSSYSGTEIVAQIVTPTDGPLVIGELQSLSYSMHRENTPCRTVGHVAPVGFVKGTRTIAGSLIFTTFDSYFFYKLPSYQSALSNGIYPVADQMPPFDIVVTFANEYGDTAKLRIFGVTIVDEQGVMSISDIITENVFSYMARGIMPMINPSQEIL